MKRKDKDVEALWAEVKRLTLEMYRLQQQFDEQTACVIVHRGSALACSDAMLAAYYDERRRAEQLAEALRELEDRAQRDEEILDELAHEIWAVAQLAPGEGIVDGVDRIVALLRREGYQNG